MPRRSLRSLAVLALALAALQARAEEVQLPSERDVEDALPEGATLTGKEIFDKFLDNRLLGPMWEFERAT